MRSLDLDRMRAIMRDRRDDFARAEPFPHVVLDDFLHPVVARALTDEFATVTEGWTFYHHVNERKRGFNDVVRMGPVARQVVADLNAPACVDALAVLTDIAGLRADPSLEGGGLSEVEPGGFVNVHTDFLSHSREPTWTRRLNLIVFLNEGWTAAEGGALELWDPDVREPVRSIVPAFNRCVIFATTATAFHGVPEVRCPPGGVRRSLALYYFEDEGARLPVRSTHYVARPGDGGLTRALIALDRALLYVYALLKRYTPFGDRLVSRLLRRL